MKFVASKTLGILCFEHDSFNYSKINIHSSNIMVTNYNLYIGSIYFEVLLNINYI